MGFWMASPHMIPMTTSVVESGFSTMNYILNEYLTCMSIIYLYVNIVTIF